jgi:hypothetical protein
LGGAGDKEGDEGLPDGSADGLPDGPAEEAEPKVEAQKQSKAEAEPVNELFMEVSDIAQEAESVKSEADVSEVKKIDPWKRKYFVVSAALRAILEHQYGVNKAVLILLDALENS